MGKINDKRRVTSAGSLLYQGMRYAAPELVDYAGQEVRVIADEQVLNPPLIEVRADGKLVCMAARGNVMTNQSVVANTNRGALYARMDACYKAALRRFGPTPEAVIHLRKAYAEAHFACGMGATLGGAMEGGAE